MIRILILMLMLFGCDLYEDVNLYNNSDYKTVEGKLYYRGLPFTGKLKKVHEKTIALINYKNGLENGRYLEIYRNGVTAKDVIYTNGQIVSLGRNFRK